MEPRIFRFFQYIQSIFFNFFAGKEIIAKKGGTGTNEGAARSDRKESWRVAPASFGVATKSVNLKGSLSFSKIFFKKENFSASSSSAFVRGIFFLFVGFVIGNLFGTFLPAIRIFFSWDGFIVIFLLFFIEFISYIRYQTNSRFFLILWDFPRGREPIPFFKEKEQFSLDLEDEKSAPPPLNNKVTDDKKGKQNNNKTAFTRDFSFFSNGTKTTFLQKTFSLAGKGYKSLNYFKIGFLLGFFIDAYKVGS